LDVSKNTKIQGVNCWGNLLSAGALNTLFEMLPTIISGSEVLEIPYNSESYECDTNIAEQKGWLFRW